MTKTISLHHINATADDLTGNHGIGRYVLLPGSDGRAKEIAQHFNNLNVKPHARGHNLYLGTLTHGNQAIDVAAVSSGMGCPSMEIILHELFHLGAKRFLRVGTAGSLQPKLIKIGDIINTLASVRDEHTTTDYVPITVPAIASLEFNLAISQAAKNLKLAKYISNGVVHCKSSLYAREFGSGPKAMWNKTYLKVLTDCGVLASEMETATLFIQSQLYNYQLQQKGHGASYRVLAGAILGVISTPPDRFATQHQEEKVIHNIVELALETIKVIAANDCKYIL